ALRVKTGGEPVEQHVDRVLLHLRCVGVVGGQCVPVGDEVEALVLILHTHPVLQRADVIAEVQFSSGAHAAKHAFTSMGRWHQILVSIPSKNESGGSISRSSNRPPK